MVEDDYIIFISYANTDRSRVEPFYEWLDTRGFYVWMDSRRLLPGQNWEFEVKRALDKASFVMAFVSANSLDRRGYVQRELKVALDRLSEKLTDDIYLIPVLLDDNFPIPDQLKGLHCIRASDPQCFDRIASALQHQLERLGIKRKELQNKEGVSWVSRIERESWDGLPGYEVDLQFLEFHSEKYPNVKEIGDYIRGNLLASLFKHRADKLNQMPNLFNYGQDKYKRTNTYDAHCREPIIRGKVITVQYSIDWYGAGAMHPNHFFQTYCFVLEPLVLVSALEDIFKQPDKALAVLQAEIREQLYQVRIGKNPEENNKLDKDWVDKGTQAWGDIASFVFRTEGIEFSFAPYQVAAYAWGSHFVAVPYTKIAALIRSVYRSALQIEHLIN